jgi:hypothetical protein
MAGILHSLSAHSHRHAFITILSTDKKALIHIERLESEHLEDYIIGMMRIGRDEKRQGTWRFYSGTAST